MQPAKNIHLISLGCARNRVDAEVMLGSCLAEGWTYCDDPAVADAIVVNTCGFIKEAKEESIDTILEAAGHKERNPELQLVVAGCLSQRYKGQLVKALPEVDLFIGTDEFVKLPTMLAEKLPKGSVRARRSNYLYQHSLPRINTLSTQSAYVKVAEGCQHNCAFCIIPAIRGPLRSRTIESVVEEVKTLVSQGVIEINLIAQDLAAYGRDRSRDELLPLLKALVEIAGLRWIRLLYIYPENIDEEFLAFFASQEKLVKYLDIPMQHASDRVLGLMNRGVNQQQLRDIIAKVRAFVPEVAIRTSVMTGFPSEDEADFAELLGFVKDCRFAHLGCFTYSQEEGTVAGRMQHQVDEAVKAARRDQVMALQQEISRDYLRSFVGKEVEVLVAGPSTETHGSWQGRMSTQAPEVDGLVYFDGDLPAGELGLVRVKITASMEYDLRGKL
jgi:ribosomal protein S12 methylthiotransferase